MALVIPVTGKCDGRLYELFSSVSIIFTIHIDHAHSNKSDRRSAAVGLAFSTSVHLLTDLPPRPKKLDMCPSAFKINKISD